MSQLIAIQYDVTKGYLDCIHSIISKYPFVPKTVSCCQRSDRGVGNKSHSILMANSCCTFQLCFDHSYTFKLSIFKRICKWTVLQTP